MPIEEIPGLLCMKKVKPKESTKNVRLTQVHGSMLAKDILTLAESIKEEKERKAGAKKEAYLKREEKLESFLKCKNECICFKPGGKCGAIKLRQCPNCHDVLKSQCGKARCKDESGTKPQMLLPPCAQQNTVFRKLVDDGSATKEDE